MKISKAIEILIENIKAKPPGMNHDYFVTLKLGTEALKAIQYMRNADPGTVCTQLHGETPEDDTT